MTQNEPATEQDFPQNYRVITPIRTMPVPVFFNPTQGTDVMTHLKNGTMVSVHSRTDLWLCIQLPDNRRGYVQTTYARPATQQEQQALQTGDADQNIKHATSPVLSTSAGVISGRKPGPNLQAAYNWLLVAVGCLILSLVAGSLVVNTCHASNSQCTASQGPLIFLAIIVFFASLLFFVIGIIVGIVILVQHWKMH